MKAELSRRSRSNRKKLKLGNYLIITDTDATEKNYFEGLKRSLPIEIQKKIDIKILKAKHNNLLQFAIDQVSIYPKYVEVWIVLDRDEVKNFDKLIKDAEKYNIHVAWTNPCIEEWFYAYFEKLPNVINSACCCKIFGDEFLKRTSQKYIKSDPNIYEKLTKYGNEEKAIQIFKDKEKYYRKQKVTKPSLMNPGGSIFVLINEISKYKNL